MLMYLIQILFKDYLSILFIYLSICYLFVDYNIFIK